MSCLLNAPAHKKNNPLTPVQLIRSTLGPISPFRSSRALTPSIRCPQHSRRIQRTQASEMLAQLSQRTAQELPLLGQLGMGVDLHARHKLGQHEKLAAPGGGVFGLNIPQAVDCAEERLQLLVT
jgi:hypothetical protein